jgi:alcohol dehydrogenase, propanol-preferring
LIGEGLCPAYRIEENLCDFPRTLGVYQDGDYSELMLIPSYKNLVKIDKLDVNSSAALACSGLTAYSAIKKAQANANETVVIIGAVGLGLMAVQIAKAMTNARIVVVDVDDRKLVEAKKLGADSTVNSMNTDPAKGIKDITEGLGSEVVIDFINKSKTAPNSINMLRKMWTSGYGRSFRWCIRLKFASCSITGISSDRLIYWCICRSDRSGCSCKI